jgi:hypothetical protein
MGRQAGVRIGDLPLFSGMNCAEILDASDLAALPKARHQ